ncbi:MAG: serine dehydratase [Crocinitomicaceae bacterium]|nr:serine dehydratase [Crocinitomicaceae bacterium]
MISKKDIELAATRIKPYVHNTPVLSSSQLNSLLDSEVYFKCENFQKVGAFKARGAFNFALQTPESLRSKGLCTHSSGNHAQAVALAAKTLGTTAYIVMPKNAPLVKIDAVKSYGAKITFCEPNLKARETTLNNIQTETNAVFVPPYDHEFIITGQATAAKELVESYPGLDTIICPVGGGGLLAGTALSALLFGNNVKVFGSEPSGADDAKQSFDAGELIPSVQPDTIADGLLTSLGTTNFPIIQEHVKDILTVDDSEIITAMRLIWERMKLIIEPSAAVPLAALIKNKSQFNHRKVGIILSGGNIDLGKSYF